MVLRWVPTQTNFLWLLLKIVIISVIDIIATNKRHYCKFEYKYKSIWLKISIFQIVKCPSYCAKVQSPQMLLLYISNKNDICPKLRETTVVIWRYSWIISIKTFRFLKTFKSSLKKYCIVPSTERRVLWNFCWHIDCQGNAKNTCKISYKEMENSSNNRDAITKTSPKVPQNGSL